jgi:aminoglycoside phosphotransferase (APT) family kinase protein
MIFKVEWEHAHSLHQVSDELIVSMLQQMCPEQTLESHRVMSGGCANINVQCKFVGMPEPQLLRIYLRDHEAAYREQALGELLYQSVPMPRIMHIGHLEAYCFALVQFKQGQSLRDVLLGDVHCDMTRLMEDVGQVLARIHAVTFGKSGFFDRNLQISSSCTGEAMLAFVQSCLQDTLVVVHLSDQVRGEIDTYFKKYADLLPDDTECGLVHADFDPSNLLVACVDGSWQVTGVLDWEFAFSGSVLCDVANMLRYAHHMPPAYEQSFLAGLCSSGIVLPGDWRITVHLLNLLSLLDCLRRGDPMNRPLQYADIKKLITHILHALARCGAKR